MKYKPDWPEAQERLTALWAGQCTGRPCLSVTAPGIADRLYAKTSGAVGDAYLSVLGAPAALPSAVMTGFSPARDAATGQPLPEESESPAPPRSSKLQCPTRPAPGALPDARRSTSVLERAQP